MVMHIQHSTAQHGMAWQSSAEWCRPRYETNRIFLWTQMSTEEAANIVHAWENVRAKVVAAAAAGTRAKGFFLSSSCCSSSFTATECAIPLAQMPQRSYKFPIEIWNGTIYLYIFQQSSSDKHMHTVISHYVYNTHIASHRIAHTLLHFVVYFRFILLWWSSSCCCCCDTAFSISALMS